MANLKQYKNNTIINLDLVTKVFIERDDNDSNACLIEFLFEQTGRVTWKVKKEKLPRVMSFLNLNRLVDEQ